MKKLLVVLLALALPVAADGPVVCSAVGPVTTTWSESVESAAAGLACDRPADGGEEAEPSVYDDAVALWKLDEASGTRADSIGSNDLTDNNTVGSTSKGVGAPANLPGTVASFVAANSENLTRAAVSPISGATGFTAAIWVKRNSPTDFCRLIGLDDGGTRSWANFYRSGATTPSFFMLHGGAQNVDGDALDTDWHLVIVWWDADADTIGVQVDDGTPDTASDAGVDDQSAATVLAIGTGGYDGLASVAAIWDRVLTPDERAALYNSGDGAPLPD